MTDKDKIDRSKLYNEVAEESLYDKCNLIGKTLHFWNWAFYIKNYGKDIELKDMPQCPKSDLSDKLTEKFDYYWNIEVQNAKEKNRKPSLIYPIYRVFFLKLLLNSIFCFLPQIFLVLQAVIMGTLVKQARDLQEKPELKNDLYLSGLAMVACHFIHVQCTNVYNSWSLHFSLRIRVALSGIMYKKVLKLSKSAFLSTSAGQIINLIANDINKLEMILHFLPYPFVACLIVVLAVVFLWNPFTYSVLISVLVLFSILPVQMFMGKLFSIYCAKAASLTDERIRLMNEFVPAIKIIKMYCWENQFAKKINEARKNEIAKIRAGAYVFSINLGLFYVTGKVVIYSCLISYVLFGNLLNAEYVFMAFALLNKMSFVATLYVPHFIRQSANGLVSLDRIRTFMTLPETKEISNKMNPLFKDKSLVRIKNLFGTYDHMEEPNKSSNGIYNKCFTMDDNFINNKKQTFERLETKEFIDYKNEAKAVNCVNGYCKEMGKCKIEKKADLSKYKIILSDIDFEVLPGELMTIGKTSILMAILDEINSIDKNSIDVKGRISFACQDAWTFAGTVKENILFGSSYDEEKYKEIVRVCALERDMTLFPQGDQTIIGERGVSLSGGQRARINLARTLYYDADIYLLDDPLSAVDPHVAKHIFKEAIQDYLKDKIVILVTHQLQFVKNSSKILLIKEGKQAAYGSYDFVLSGKMEFSKFVGIDTNDQKNQTKGRTDSSSQFGSTLSINSISNETTVPTKSRLSIDSTIDIEVIEKLKSIKGEEDDNKLKKRQVIKEVTALQFSRKAYYTYFRLGLAGWIGPILIVTFLLAQAIYSYSDYFLSLWTTSEERRNNETIGSDDKLSFVDNLTQHQSIWIYSGLMIALFVLSLLRALLFFKSCMNSSVKLHDRLFKKAFRNLYLRTAKSIRMLG